jgi:O-antigen/teichoic acid export membrane protein
MIKSITLTLRNFFSQGHERTIKAKKNIAASLLIKGASIVVSFMMVPLTIDYVNPTQYGIWLTLSSVIVWFGFFDIGLGNGLRNKLAEALAKDDILNARKYISTAYAFLGGISILIILLYSVVKPFINWSKFLNAPPSLSHELNTLAFFIIILFSMQFVLQLIGIIFYALQNTAKVSLMFLAGNIISFVIVLVLKYTTQGSLLYLGLSLFIGNLVSVLGFSLWFFNFVRKDLKPSFVLIKPEYAKGLLNLGSQFFIIQISSIVQYETTNIIISRYFSPLEVTQYSIPYKLFSALYMVFNLLIAPLWSSVTEAFFKKDFNWIIKTQQRLVSFWRYMVLIALVLLLCCNFIYKIWLHNQVIIPFSTSLGIMLYILCLSYGSIYVTILNGIGALKLQFQLSIITMILFIPLTYLLAVTFHMGIIGISFSLIICNVNGIIAAPYQYKKLIYQHKTV